MSAGTGSLGTGCEGVTEAFSPSHREFIRAMKSVAKQQNLKQFDWHLGFQSVRSFIN